MREGIGGAERANVCMTMRGLGKSPGDILVTSSRIKSEFVVRSEDRELSRKHVLNTKCRKIQGKNKPGALPASGIKPNGNKI